MLNKGFSLFEVLICLLIMNIFIIGISTFAEKYNYQTLDSISREISSAVRFAKFFAIIRGEKLILKCKTSNDCSLGLRLYNKKTKEIIKQWDWPYNKNKIFWHGFNTTNELVFTSDIKRNAANGKFNILYRNKVVKILIVNRLGTIRSEYP